MTDVLALTAELAERTTTEGEVLYHQGDAVTSVLVLVRGELVIEVDGVVVDRHVSPGTFVGETGALLGRPRNATVIAGADTVIREIGAPEEFFAAHPALGVELARQLAGRLERLRSYVGEVRRQFADRDDHLGLFGDLLERIATTAPVDLDGGSDRAPDY